MGTITISPDKSTNTDETNHEHKPTHLRENMVSAAFSREIQKKSDETIHNKALYQQNRANKHIALLKEQIRRRIFAK